MAILKRLSANLRSYLAGVYLLMRKTSTYVARNTLVLLVAFVGSCLSAEMIVTTGQAVILSQLDDNPHYQSILEVANHLALSSVGIGSLVAIATVLPVLTGFLVNRVRSPSNLALCLVAGGLYGFCGGLVLEGYRHSDYVLVRAAVWGTAGIAGGAVFSLIVRRMEEAMRIESSA